MTDTNQNLIARSHRRHGQDKTVLSYPCWQREQAIRKIW